MDSKPARYLRSGGTLIVDMRLIDNSVEHRRPTLQQDSGLALLLIVVHIDIPAASETVTNAAARH